MSRMSVKLSPSGLVFGEEEATTQRNSPTVGFESIEDDIFCGTEPRPEKVSA